MPDRTTPPSRLPAHAAILAVMVATTTLGADSPFATEVVAFDPGIGGVPGYDFPEAALGEPTRTTGGGLFPAAVTPFQPAFLASELVSLGVGGSIVLAFDHQVLDDPANPYGIDLLVFGNAFLSDLAPPAGIAGGLYSEGGRIEVSQDGVVWFGVADIEADGPMPTIGWRDVGPYADAGGRLPTDFTRPVDPTRGPQDMAGLGHLEIIEMYDGSGGGAGIDLATIGLDWIRFVRLSNDGDVSTPEIDAIADVAPDDSPGMPGDLDGNGVVDGIDLGLMLAAWGTDDPAANLDGLGVVGGPDLGLLLAGWSE